MTTPTDDRFRTVTLSQLHDLTSQYDRRDDSGTRVLDGFPDLHPEVVVSDLSGSEDPDTLTRFTNKLKTVIRDVQELDNLFHDLWDCR